MGFFDVWTFGPRSGRVFFVDCFFFCVPVSVLPGLAQRRARRSVSGNKGGRDWLVQEATLRAARPLSATLSLGNALGDTVSGTFSGQTWTWRAWTPWCSTSLICCRVVA